MRMLDCPMPVCVCVLCVLCVLCVCVCVCVWLWLWLHSLLEPPSLYVYAVGEGSKKKRGRREQEEATKRATQRKEQGETTIRATVTRVTAATAAHRNSIVPFCLSQQERQRIDDNKSDYTTRPHTQQQQGELITCHMDSG